MNTTRARKIVVGDVHGELAGLREVLRHSGLIDNRDDWAGGRAVLIQTGDVIDRGPQSVEAMALLRKLQEKAEPEGGKVVRLCGNHELMLLQGNYSCANVAEPARLAGELRKEILAKDLAAAYTDGVRLYTHAGLRSSVRHVLEEERAPGRPGSRKEQTALQTLADRINRALINALRSKDMKSHPIFHVDRKRGGPHESGGIFWGDYTRIEGSLRAYDIPQVFGHTPSRQGRVQHARGLKLIDIDCGMCRVYGGNRACLEIEPSGVVIEQHKSAGRWKKTTLAENADQ